MSLPRVSISFAQDVLSLLIGADLPGHWEVIRCRVSINAERRIKNSNMLEKKYCWCQSPESPAWCVSYSYLPTFRSEAFFQNNSNVTTTCSTMHVLIYFLNNTHSHTLSAFSPAYLYESDETNTICFKHLCRGRCDIH